MKKEVEELIEKKAKNIAEKYFFSNPEFIITNEILVIKNIKSILFKTLVTPERRIFLCKKYSNPPFKDIFASKSNIYFSPDFEEALKYLHPHYAFSFFNSITSEKMDLICCSEHAICSELYGIRYYFTQQELYDTLNNFILFLENNKDSIIEKGWPRHHFSLSPWFFYQYAPSYPIEIPCYIKKYNRIKFPDSNPYFFFKNYFLKNSNKESKYLQKMTSLIKLFSLKNLFF